jgi:hypothetical protein
MKTDLNAEMGETLLRFISHWIAAVFGHFLRVLLPIMIEWSPHPVPTTFPRWWSVLLFAGTTSLLAAIINANLPVTARELVKSVAMGFALNTTVVMLKMA